MDAELPADHVARLIDAEILPSDVEDLIREYRGVGTAAHRPELLLKGILLQVAQGVSSPAQWFRSFQDSRAMQWISFGCRPSRSVLYAFRDRLLPVIDRISLRIVRQCQADGRVAGDICVLDGSTVRSQASRHRLVNRRKLMCRLEQLEAAIQHDDVHQPVASIPSWMGLTPRGRKGQRARCLTALEVLDARLQENAKRPKDKRLDEKHVQVSLTDPEAAIVRDKEKVLCPGYNVQFQVDRKSLLIVAYATEAKATDADSLPPMLDLTKQVLGRYPGIQQADAGHVSIQDLIDCHTRGVQLCGPYQENDFTALKRVGKAQAQFGKDKFRWLADHATYECPQGHRLKPESRNKRSRRGGEVTLVQTRYRCPPVHCLHCPLRQACCQNPANGRTVKRYEGEEHVEAHRRRMEEPEAKTLNRQRGSIIERTFADMKQHRKLRRFHGRGRDRAHIEVGLTVLVINLLGLRRLLHPDKMPQKHRT